MSFYLLGEQAIPIRNIFAIGRNFSEHAKELGNTIPKEPIVFMKPSSSVIQSGEPIRLPSNSQDVHHEAELVIAIGKPARRVKERDALKYIHAYGVGLDITARDLQSQAKKEGKPWFVSKGFDTFAPLSPFVSAENIDSFDQLDFRLEVNGELRQQGDPSQMLFSLPKIIHYLSSIVTLDFGDLIFTGTPSGVAPLLEGDEVVLSLVGGECHFTSVVLADTCSL